MYVYGKRAVNLQKFKTKEQYVGIFITHLLDTNWMKLIPSVTLINVRSVMRRFNVSKFEIWQNWCQLLKFNYWVKTCRKYLKQLMMIIVIIMKCTFTLTQLSDIDYRITKETLYIISILLFLLFSLLKAKWYPLSLGNAREVVDSEPISAFHAYGNCWMI